MKNKAAGKEGLKMPMGNAHWEMKPGNVDVADAKYSGEFNNPERLKESVNKLAGYVKKHRMQY